MKTEDEVEVRGEPSEVRYYGPPTPQLGQGDEEDLTKTLCWSALP